MRNLLRGVAILLIFFLFPLPCFGTNPETIAGPDYTTPCLLTLLGIGIIWVVVTAPAKDEIQVVSEPAGARIEIDGDYKGVAPLTVKISRKRHSTLSIKAYPITGSGNYVQTKFIDEYTDTPKNVFFDMTIEPAPQKQEIKITQ